MQSRLVAARFPWPVAAASNHCVSDWVAAPEQSEVTDNTSLDCGAYDRATRAAGARSVEPWAGVVRFAADGSLTAGAGAAGMVSGLTSGLAARAVDGPSGSPAVWVCAAMSEADRAAARRGAVLAGGGPGDVPVLMLEIPAATFEAAYNGIANSVLWFVHHLLYDTPNQPVRRRSSAPTGPRTSPTTTAFAAALARRSPGIGARVADPGLPPGAGAAAAARPAAGCPDRALLAHAVGAAGVLPHAARRRGGGDPGRHARRGSPGLPRRPVGRRVPGLLRGGARRARRPR